MKQQFRLTRLLLSLVFVLAAWMAGQASTMFVKGTTTAPYFKIGDGSYAQMTQKVTSSDNAVWYYADVASGSTVTFATNGSGSNASPAITFDSSADSYFEYNGTGYGVNLTRIKNATSYILLEISRDDWFITDANSYVYAWGNSGHNKDFPGEKVIEQNNRWGGTYYIGGNNGGSSMFLWTSNTMTPTHLKVFRSDGNNNEWNSSGEQTYYKGDLYKSGENWYRDNYQMYNNIAWPVNINTGELYIVGYANGNPWQPNVGIQMTPTNEACTQFKAEKVLLTPGNSGFAFATRLADDEDDWTTLNSHRYGSTAGTGTWLFTENLLGQWHNNLKVDNGAQKNFVVSSGGYYDIEVDLENMQVKLTHAYNALYMYYGHSGSATWNANGGVNMMTNDGETFTLSNVELKAGDTFQFTKQLGTAANIWPDAESRLGAKGGPRTLSNDDLNQVLSDALDKGGNDFVMGEETGGTYRVVVNLTDNSVALYNMATLQGKVIIHLEKTANVTDPLIWAYDKEAYENGDPVHEDRPSRYVIATDRKKLLVGMAPSKVSTVGGRTWWTWEVNDAMTDFWFTRGTYQYTPDATVPDATDDDMTDINWRKSGELFFTWPGTGTTLDDYTRDYYAAAAQEAAECAVMIEGHLYAYFTNTPGWEHVYCHAWYTKEDKTNQDLLQNPYIDGDNNWYPGVMCDMVGYDKDGYEVWRIDLTAHGVTTTPNGIIFNNGVYKGHDYYTNADATFAAAQTSDFVYSTGTCYDYCGVIVLGSSLGGIIRNGKVNGPVYTIADALVGVYVDPMATTEIEVDNTKHTVFGALYCKDLNQFATTSYVEKSLQQNGEIDYVLDLTQLMGDKSHYDQSNWVKLTLSTQYPTNIATMSKEAQIALLRNYVNKLLPGNTVHAQLVNNKNPEMRLALDGALPELSKCSDYTYDPNVFVTQNFVGSQNSGIPGSSKRYFFVTPKPQEFATVTWAVYGGDDMFYVPTRHAYTGDGHFAWMNEADLDGGFKVTWDLQDKPTALDEDYAKDNAESKGQAYQFHAIIRLANETETTADSNEPQRVPSQPFKNEVAQTKYVVSPIDLTTEGEGVVTAIVDTRATRTVKAVRYYNVAGMVSDKPFEGVNIIVTDYSDGTRTTKRIMSPQ